MVWGRLASHPDAVLLGEVDHRQAVLGGNVTDVVVDPSGLGQGEVASDLGGFDYFRGAG